MPGTEEHQQEFIDLAGNILGVEVINRAQVIHLGAVAKSALVKKRDEFTKEITKAWKDGFVKLKAENDQMQHDLKEAFGYVHADINDSIVDMLKKCKK